MIQAMEVWLWDTIMWPYPGRRAAVPFPLADYDDARAAALFDDHIRLAALADSLGIDGVCTAEHHAGAAGFCPAPNIWAAAVAARTERIRLGALGNVLPMCDHPLRLAEELAMIDILSHGRLTCGFIPGGRTQVAAYGVRPEELRGRFEEAWRVVLRAWTAEEPFDWDGTFFHYPRAAVYPRPWQKPHPPIVTVGRSADSLGWAAEHRTPLTCSFSSVDDAARIFDSFEQAALARGWLPGAAGKRLCRVVYLAETRERALEEAERHVLTYFEESLATKAVFPRHVEAAHRRGVPVFQQLCDQGVVIVGDPDGVAAEILRQRARLGFGAILLALPFATLPMALAERALRLLDRTVLRELQAAGAGAPEQPAPTG